ncbi:MAG: helix-turn-helix domain-containing protein [Oscillospiraceae bacterium]|nr:helix-turn-helix domain-containing protein [Oscillospiraceae bacterium]
MKTYSVKEIAEILNTNPETVRRWIRDKKLDASIESKKGGHIVYEAALQEFLRSSPKYAAIAKTSIAGAAVLSTVVVGGLVAAQKLIDLDQLKKARISTQDVVLFLRGEIQKSQDAIKSKEATIHQLQKQIEADQSQISEYQKLIDNLSREKEAAYE